MVTGVGGGGGGGMPPDSKMTFKSDNEGWEIL